MATVVQTKPGRPKRRKPPFPNYNVVSRTFLQERYNVERWNQMVSEPVRRARPYWIFDAILDGRTTEICSVCNGTVLPWDAVWWQSHKPPIHWGCRSIIRCITASAARKRGITVELPAHEPLDGFGLAPGLSAQKLLDKTKYDARLIASADKKVQKTTPIKTIVTNKPKTRAEAIQALRVIARNVTVAEGFDAVAVEALLREQGAYQLLAGFPIDDLVIGAKDGKGYLSRFNHGPVEEIKAGTTGLYSNTTLHGQSYLKVSKYAKNLDELALQKTLEARTKAGLPALDPIGPNANYVKTPGYKTLDNTLTHEFGHAVHMTQTGKYAEIDALISDAYKDESRQDVSKYGAKNHEEYFAESYLAYRNRHDEMKAVAPKAYDMVRKVLKLRGMPL